MSRFLGNCAPDRVTLTDRLEGLTLCIRLHPTEVCNSFAYLPRPKIEKGDYPDEPMSGLISRIARMNGRDDGFHVRNSIFMKT